MAELGRELPGKPEEEAEYLNIPPVRIYIWRKKQVSHVEAQDASTPRLKTCL